MRKRKLGERENGVFLLFLFLSPLRDGDYLGQDLPSQGGQQRCGEEAGRGSQQSHVRPGFSGESVSVCNKMGNVVGAFILILL